MKRVTFYVRPKGYSTGTESAYETTYEWNNDHPTEWFLQYYDKLIEMVKKNDKTAEFIEARIACKPTHGFTKALLEKIGNEVASVYGAVCTSVKCFLNSVEFHCNECGEKFTTLMTYDEIKQEYASLL